MAHAKTKTPRRFMLSTVLLAALPLSMLIPAPIRAEPKNAAKRELAAPIQDQMTLRCLYKQSTTINAGPDGIKGEVLPGGGSLSFTTVDGRLVVTGDSGGEKLRLLGSTPEIGVMFFIEATAINNMILWSFYRLSGRKILFFKQNNYSPTLDADQGVVAWNYSGICDVTGGNGRPIIK